MRKWEYNWIRHSDIDTFGERVDAAGVDGWELVSVTHAAISAEEGSVYTAFFKRPNE